MPNIFLKSLFALGLRGFNLVLRPFLNKEIVVLNYHSVAKDEWFYSVNPEIFEKQIKFLSKNFNVLSIDKIADYIEGKINLPTRSVAITFDDGYNNFLTNALPILKKYNLPVAIFIIGERSAAAEDVNKETPLLKDNEVKILSDAGVTIGSHGLTHRSLNKLSPAEIVKELSESKNRLEKLIGQPVRFLSYPKGKFNQTVIDLAQQAGYKAAFSIKQGLVRHDCNKFVIKRVVVDRNQNMLIFKIRLTKAVDWWTKLWQFYH